MTQPKPFSNPSSQSERQRILREERQRLRAPPAPTTLRDLARVDEILGAQGRFATEAAVTGSDPAALYPRVPNDTPWSMQNAVEPPLGYSVEEVDPVGEAHEVAASRGVARAATAPEAPLSSVDPVETTACASIIRKVVVRRKL
jgi:hypothetical protein